MRYNQIGEDGVKSLGPYLAQLTTIRQLDLSNNRIGDDGVKSLGPQLAHLSSIHPATSSEMRRDW